MNSWDYNELTQQDMLDFKACKHNETGKIYGIKDSSDCQSGKEISKSDMEKLAIREKQGDKQAGKELDAIVAAKKKGEQETKKAAKEAEAQKKQKEHEAACKSGAKKGKECKGIKKEKGGKGKKGGGKGKGKGGAGKKGGGGKGAAKGKGGKGGGKAAQPAAKQTARNTQQSQRESRQRQVESARKGVKALQDALASIKNPKQRARIEEKIADLLTQVAQLSMPNMPAGQAQQVAQGQTPQAPAQGQEQSKDKA